MMVLNSATTLVCSPCRAPPRSPTPRRSTAACVTRATAGSSPGEACPPSEGSGSGSLHDTIASLDLFLEVAPAEPTSTVAPAAAEAAAATSATIPPEWLNLPAEEQRRRQLLVQRRMMLGLRQADLQRDCDQQERKLAAAQQRMAALQLQMRQLVAQQKEVSAMIDPEAAAAVRQAAVEAAERAEVEGRRDVFITLVGIIAFYGVAATSISREIGENRRRNNARDNCMLD